MALVIARHLRFAWLEYEDPRDAVAFDRAVSSATLGWRNLFLDLAEGAGGSRIDVSNQTPLLEINWAANVDNPAEKGLLARPGDPHSVFIEDWLVNPGVIAVGRGTSP